MKKIFHIAIVLGFIIGSASCQKSELEDVLEQVDTTTDESLTRQGEGNFSDIGYSTEDKDDADEGEDDEFGSVKEVSDGDEEADSGDDSKTSN